MWERGARRPVRGSWPRSAPCPWRSRAARRSFPRRTSAPRRNASGWSPRRPPSAPPTSSGVALPGAAAGGCAPSHGGRLRFPCVPGARLPWTCAAFSGGSRSATARPASR
ncbi:hypothetical protein G6F35_018228 [Rhizopus arrhizus]|nr:hypothetical protein G6F35_018228 [Rhizopus arrhizus]